MIRKGVFLSLIAASLGGPYLAERFQAPETWQQVQNALSSTESQSPSASSGEEAVQKLLAHVDQYAATADEQAVEAVDGAVDQAADAVPSEEEFADESSSAAGLLHDPVQQPLAGPEGDLAELLRFDIDKAWILNRWPRVTTRLANLKLEGYRVPVVTGTHQGALAGSLTYYFDSQQQLKRIVFLGTTGDAGPLVAFLTAIYGFKHKPVNDPGTYIYQVRAEREQAESELRVYTAPVIDSEQPLQRFNVALWLERPRPLDSQQPQSLVDVFGKWFGGR